MKTLTVTSTMAIAAFGCVLTAQAVVNPFGDSIFWWRGGRDGANGCDRDGLFSQGELVDVRHAKDQTFWNRSWSARTNKAVDGGVVVDKILSYQSETVTAPYACESYQAQTLYFPQIFSVTTNYSGTGQITDIRWRAQQISRLYLPEIFRDSYVNGTCPNWTAFVRFRRDGVDERPATPLFESMMLLDYAWGSAKGIGVNFYCDGTSQASANMRISIGQYQHFPGLTVTRGQWVDLAISVAGKVVTVCWCAQNGKFGSYTYDVTSSAQVSDLAMSASSYIHVGTDLNLSYDNDTLVYNAATGGYSAGNNAYMAFRGAIAQLAFWDRALDKYEVQQVFGYPRPAAMTVGVKDGGTNEYLSASAMVEAGNGRWEDLNPSLTAGQSCTVSFMLTEQKASLPQLLRIFPATGSASGRLSVTLNGNSIIQDAFDGSRTFLKFIKAKFFTTGVNSLTITRTDSGVGDILIDSIEMSGSYMLGVDSAQTPFSHEDLPTTIFDFDMACGAESNFVSALNVKKSHDCRLSVTFPLDAETLRAAIGMSYRTRLATSSGVDFSASRFAINGHVFKEYGANEFPTTLGEYLGDFDIPLEFLQNGTNTFTFSADYIGGDVSKWKGFSFHRFELKPVPPGMAIFVR